MVSEYHLEAAIAATHALARSAEETPWGDIVELYDALLRIRPSPVVALNRAVAVAEQLGPERGLEALRSIPGAERLAAYPFYPAALGELELRTGHVVEARKHFRAAHRLARNSRGADLPRPAPRGVRATTRLRATSPASGVSATVAACYTARRRWLRPSMTLPSPSGRRTWSPSPRWVRRCSSPA